VRPSLYAYAGGEPALLALARAHHARCLADPLLSHPFSHPGQHPDHGGGDQSSVLRLHAGHGEGMVELGRIFVDCFVAALDDAGLPDDPEFRAAMRAYMEWSVADLDTLNPEGSTVPDGLGMPRWDWDGLVRA
jgi:hemoglobin